MRDDLAPGQVGDPIKTTAPSSAPPESRSPKRLLADPKSKDRLTATSSDSALSSDSSSDRPRKKTRDLPNLSDCHSCGVHINNTDPRDRLQTLDSFWRIVLLCRKCVKRVGSAELCSYCFSEAGTDCYRCRDCEHRVHRECVVRYQSFAPWSYCCSELGFSVCVDCWLPKLLTDSVRVDKKRRNKKKCPTGDSRVSSIDGSSKSLEDVANDAKSVMEKKTAVAAKAKENALRKAVVARRAAELANGALELVAKKDGKGAKNECSVTSSGSGSNAASKVVHDVELAFQLHRVINSSPRISKNLCLINSSYLPVPTVQECNGNSLFWSSGSIGSPDPSFSGQIKLCPNDESKESSNTTDSCFSVGNLKWEGLVYTRRCKRDMEYQEKGGEMVGHCNPIDDKRLIIKPQISQEQDEPKYELHSDDTRNQVKLTCDGNNALRHNDRCNTRPDRYMLKYGKRKLDRYMLKYSKRRLDRYKLKYSKRSVSSKTTSTSKTKILCDGYCVESNARALGLSISCSEECRTFSDDSLQRRTVPSVEAHHEIHH